MLACILCADLCSVKHETDCKVGDNAPLSQDTLTPSKNFDGLCFPLVEGCPGVELLCFALGGPNYAVESL